MPQHNYQNITYFFLTNNYISSLTLMYTDKILILIIVEIYVVILRVVNIVR
jgi:hypothetical protein